MKTIVTALALSSLIAVPAFAKSLGHHTRPQSAYAALTPAGSPTAVGPRHEAAAGNPREAAVHQCAMMSRQYTETTWATMQVYQFRACMMEHQQPE